MSSNSVRTPMTLHLPFAASSVPLARQRLNSFLGEAGGSAESIEDARTVISELVGNAVRHARPLSDGSLVVSWALEDDSLEVSVTDGGSSTLPRAVRTATSAVTGRGMAIVEVLSERWWSERTECRSTVHARLHV